MIKPDYYRSGDGTDLFDKIEAGLLPEEQVRGFYKGNAFKYIVRYENKNGVEDIDKSITYLERLKKFETNLKAYQNKPANTNDHVVIKGGQE